MPKLIAIYKRMNGEVTRVEVTGIIQGRKGK